MKKLGRYGPTMQRVPPVGVISRPDDSARAISNRLARRPGARKEAKKLLVFADAGYVYAVETRSQMAEQLPPESIIGVYSWRAGSNFIAEDIDAWRKAA